MTKIDKFNTILAVLDTAENEGFTLPNGYTFADLKTTMENEITILNNKKVSAQKKAAEKKAAGDELQNKILEILNYDTYIAVDDIVAALQKDDPEITKNKVTSRFNALGPKGSNVIEKGDVTLPPIVEGGKARVVSGYKRIG